MQKLHRTLTATASCSNHSVTVLSKEGLCTHPSEESRLYTLKVKLHKIKDMFVKMTYSHKSH